MSIASEITRISGNIADAYTALNAKGATMPAAGSQNSDNLADTIDTISTGGSGETVVRGGWIVPQEYLHLDNICSSLSNFTTQYHMSTQYEERDITFGSSTYTSSPYTIGYVFTNDIAVVRFNSDMAFGVWISEGATLVKNPYDYTNFAIVFPTNATFRACAFIFKVDPVQEAHWSITIYNQEALDNSVSGELTSSNFSSLSPSIPTGNANLLLPYVKYITINNVEYQTASRTLSGTWGTGTFGTGASKCLEDVHIEHFTITNGYTTLKSAVTQRDRSLLYAHLLNQDFVKQIYPNDYLTPIDVSDLAFTNTFWKILPFWRRFPAILDLSSSTKTGTLEIGDSTFFGNSGISETKLRHLKIKLPSTHSITFKGSGSMWGGPTLDYESLDYMCTNAPTVDSSSGLTVRFNLNNATAVDKIHPTFKTTMESKGWTVTAN